MIKWFCRDYDGGGKWVQGGQMNCLAPASFSAHPRAGPDIPDALQMNCLARTSLVHSPRRKWAPIFDVFLIVFGKMSGKFRMRLEIR